jgi:pimeloyl-ACP methyl ester carboxylesterase
LYKLAREKDYVDATLEMKQSMINLIKTDIKPYLSQLRVKTLIIWGKEDKITPLTDGMMMQSLINNSHLVVIDEARHSPFYTHPEKVIEIIKNDI